MHGFFSFSLFSIGIYAVDQRPHVSQPASALQQKHALHFSFRVHFLLEFCLRFQKRNILALAMKEDVKRNSAFQKNTGGISINTED